MRASTAGMMFMQKRQQALLAHTHVSYAWNASASGRYSSTFLLSHMIFAYKEPLAAGSPVTAKYRLTFLCSTITWGLTVQAVAALAAQQGKLTHLMAYQRARTRTAAPGTRTLIQRINRSKCPNRECEYHRGFQSCHSAASYLPFSVFHALFCLPSTSPLPATIETERKRLAGDLGDFSD